MSNLAANILSGIVGYSISKASEKKKIKNSNLAEYIDRYVKEHPDLNKQDLANDLRRIAEFYENFSDFKNLKVY